MRIAEYKQIGTKPQAKVIQHETETDPETGEFLTAWDEEITVEVPVMGMVYRDETPEEIAMREAQEAEMRRQEEEAFWAMPYPDRVEKLIRERYTLSDELALSRQRETKPEEFEAYFAFCEDCKVRARSELG